MGILNSGPGTFFWATLKIPVNAKITGVSYRRWATAASKSNVAVDRVRPGTTPSWQRIYDGQSTEISPAVRPGPPSSAPTSARRRRSRPGGTTSSSPTRRPTSASATSPSSTRRRSPGGAAEGPDTEGGSRCIPCPGFGPRSPGSP
jgi:hypothetical protein